MKPFPKSLNSALLLTTMLIAPTAAFAQQPAAPAQPPAAEAPAEEPASDEIVVLGKFIPEPMRQTSEVATFLSAADLARQGDDTAASALTRLTGLSVVSGRFVFVRGLGDRYSSALLNGSPLPSPEPLRRTVPLDLFPSNILSGATVQKTYSPNYPGDFGGGIIDLRTIGIPNAPFLNLKFGASVNPTTTTLKNGLVHRGGDSDWTGYDDGTRKLPGAISSALGVNRPFNNQNFTNAQLEAIGESLTNSPLTVLQSMEIPANVDFEATGGTSFQFGKYNLGLVGVGGFDSDWRSREAKFGNSRTSTFFGVRDRTVWETTANALGSVSLGWDDHEIKGTLLYVHNTSKESGVSTTNDRSTDEVRRRESTGWFERELISGQLAGKHEFGDLDLSWRIGGAQSTREAPYDRFVTYTLERATGEFFYPAGSNRNGVGFSDLTDEVASAGIDATYTIALSEQRDAKISAGFDTQHTVRNFDSLGLGFFAINDPSARLVIRPDFLFSPDNIGTRFELRVNEQFNTGYKGDLLVNAGYIAADVEVLPLIRTSVGVRYEDGGQEVRSFSRFGQPAAPFVRNENTYWLPAATVTWNFAEDLQLRLGYSQTIARPQFRELGAARYRDPDSSRDYRGNPFLVDSELQNYDARMEYYFGRNQFVTGSVFFKTIDKPIEELISATAGEATTLFYNAPKAEIYGAEFEYRTNFEMPFFKQKFFTDKDWLFSFNYTYTSAEVRVDNPNALIVNPSRVGPSTQSIADLLVPAGQLVRDGAQLQGQSPHIVNLQFGWEDANSQMTLLVGYTDDRVLQRSGTLGAGGVFVDQSIIEEPGVNVDLVYKRDFTVGGRDFGLSLSGRNLLGTKNVERFANTDEDFNTYARGFSLSASLTAKF